MNNRMQPDATSPYFVFQKRGLFCLWIVIIIYVALSEAEIFPTSFLGKSAETKYFSDIISIITAIGGSFLAYSLPSWKRVAAILGQPTTAQRYPAFFATTVSLLQAHRFIAFLLL